MLLVNIFFPLVIMASPGVRVAVIGDYGSGTQDERAVAALVSSWRPDAIVTVGDNRYGIPYSRAVGDFYGAWLPDRFWPALGNHDYTDLGGLNEYLGYFGVRRFYVTQVGDCDFFVLDSTGMLADADDRLVQKTWLHNKLHMSTARWKIVAFHHPPWSSGPHGSTPALQWPYADWGADLVLTGHDHTYERIQVGGLTYVVDGLGGHSRYTFGAPVAGSQARFDADFGALLIDARANVMRLEFVDVHGQVIDRASVP